MFFQQKKIVISTTITQKEFDICKQKHLKYNYVFSQGIQALNNAGPLAQRLQEAEDANKELVSKLERLMGKINALETKFANRGE